MRAIESKELEAFRDNKNHWKIHPDALRKWASAHPTPTDQIQEPSGHAHEEPTPTPTKEDPATLAELRIALAENQYLKERITALEADRDSWKAMAEKLVDRPRKIWWPWSK